LVRTSHALVGSMFPVGGILDRKSSQFLGQVVRC
jgi:hypothetical protein